MKKKETTYKFMSDVGISRQDLTYIRIGIYRKRMDNEMAKDVIITEYKRLTREMRIEGLIQEGNDADWKIDSTDGSNIIFQIETDKVTDENLKQIDEFRIRLDKKFVYLKELREDLKILGDINKWKIIEF